MSKVLAKRFFLKISLYISIIFVLFYFWILFSNNEQTLEAPKIDEKEILSISSDDYIEGPKEARITLIEYFDPECEACRAYYPLLKRLKEKYKDDLTIVYRYFPLPGHKNSTTWASALEAAWLQWKFSEMKNILFENQVKWWESAFTDITIFYPYAEKIGLDMNKFKKDVYEWSTLKRILKDKNSGTSLWVTWTPSFFLNWSKIINPKTYEDFEILINAELIKTPQNLGVKVHEHADMKVYLEWKVLDLGQAKYQSTDDKPLDTDTHLHDGNGNNVHKHRTKKTIWDLFKSIWIIFTSSCFTLDTWEAYCNTEEKTLKFFVNRKENKDFWNFEFSDLDRLLISYGNESPEEIQKQLESVSDQACMYSEKCPERGKPPTENCVVWLGGDC